MNVSIKRFGSKLWPRSFIRTLCTYYTENHEWIRKEGEIGTVGITSYAKDLLGEVNYVEINKVGTKFKTGDILGYVECSKAASDIIASLSGEIHEINNKAMEKSPKVVNQSPENEGWLLKIKIEDDKELLRHMDGRQYADYLQNDSNQ